MTMSEPVHVSDSIREWMASVGEEPKPGRCAALGCNVSGWLTWRATVTQGDREHVDDLVLCERHVDLVAVGFKLARTGRASA